MGKKLTIEYVRGKIEEIKYRLLSNVYVNSKHKLKIKCDKGHEYLSTWGNFHNGRRCPKCFGTPKKTIEEIRSYIESKGYKLLSNVYINAFDKLLLRCSRGHEYKVIWNNFQQGQGGCPECDPSRKKTIEEVRAYIENMGYKLLSNEYVNNKTELLIRCPDGHEFYTNWEYFSSDRRCSESRGSRRKTIEGIREYIESEDYELLSTEYINAHTKMLMKCDKGHKLWMSWDAFGIAGTRCTKCSGRGKKTIEEIRSEIGKIKYVLKTDVYKNNNTKMLMECNEGHEFWMSWSSFRGGTRCRKCYEKKKIKYRGDSIIDYYSYRECVDRLTNHSYHKYFYRINPQKYKRSSMGYHLDHIFSVADGYKYNILPRIIASPINLQMLPATENIRKRDVSAITRKELLKRYKELCL